MGSSSSVHDRNAAIVDYCPVNPAGIKSRMVGTRKYFTTNKLFTKAFSLLELIVMFCFYIR